MLAVRRCATHLCIEHLWFWTTAFSNINRYSVLFTTVNWSPTAQTSMFTMVTWLPTVQAWIAVLVNWSPTGSLPKHQFCNGKFVAHSSCINCCKSNLVTSWSQTSIFAWVTWSPTAQVQALARNPQPGILSQQSSARSSQPGVLSQESSVRNFPSEALSQEFAARCPRPELSWESSSLIPQAGDLSQKSSAGNPQAAILSLETSSQKSSASGHQPGRRRIFFCFQPVVQRQM